MRGKIASLAVAIAISLGGLISVSPMPQAQATTTTAQPAKVALVIFEDQSYTDLTSCDTSIFGVVPDPYICNNLVNESLGDLALTNYHESVSGGVKGGSAEQYAYMTSGDNCSTFSTGGFNGWMNGGNAAINATDCGVDIFQQLDNAAANGVSVDWRAYQEGFSGTTACTDGYSEPPYTSGFNHQQYARRHSPATFYADISGDCVAGGGSGNVLTFPNDASTGVDNLPINNPGNQNGHPFSGVTLGSHSLNVIIPNMCHHMHANAMTDTMAADYDSHVKERCQYTSPSTISNATHVSTLVTLTGPNNSQFQVGEQVTISGVGCTGCSGSGYNGTYTLTTVGASTIKYNDSNTLGTYSASSGTASMDAWGLDTSGNQIPGGYSGSCSINPPPDGMGGYLSDASCAQIYAGDQWLAYNLPDIREGVGSTGVVIVTFDEDGKGGATAGKVATFLIPGTTSGVSGVMQACDATCHAASYDHASVIRALVDAFHSLEAGGHTDIACSHLNGTISTLGYGRCQAVATLLPIQLTVPPALVQSSSNGQTGGTNVNVTASFASNTTAGNTLVDVITFSGGGSVSSGPAGFTLGSSSSNVSIYYKGNAAQVNAGTAITATLSSSAGWTSTLLEYSGLSATPADASGSYSSLSSTVTTLDTGTSTTSSQANEIVIGAFTDTGGTAITGGTLTANYTLRQTPSAAAGNNWTGVADRVVNATGTFRITGTISSASKVRGAILTLK